MRDEELLSLAEAAKCLPLVDGKRIHRSAVYRWCTVGVKGVYLESIQVAGRICTSREAIQRFQQLLAEARGTPMEAYRTQPKPTKSKTANSRPTLKGKRRTPAQRRAAKKQAKDTLRRLGV